MNSWPRDSQPLFSGRLEMIVDDKKNEILVSGVDDVLDIIKSDYDKAYFLTGEVMFLHHLLWLVLT